MRQDDLVLEALQRSRDALSQMLGPKPNADVENTVRGYYQFQHGLSEERARDEVAAAFEVARLKHPDFDRYKTAMTFVASFVVPDTRGIVGALSLDQYIEILYAAAKHADFLGFRDSSVQ